MIFEWFRHFLSDVATQDPATYPEEFHWGHPPLNMKKYSSLYVYVWTYVENL